MADQELKVVLRFDSKEVATGAPEAAAQIDAVGQAAERAGKTGSAAFTGMNQAAKALPDEFDLIQARLNKLQQEYAASQASAVAQMKSIEEAATVAAPVVAKAGNEMAAAADKSAFATAGARRELIVLGHEALTGNFSRMPGSFMVLAERASFSGAAMLGIVAPIAAVAAGAYVLAKAFSEGHAEMLAMDNAIAVTGDYAGVTRGQMIGLAQDVSAASNMTIAQSKGMVTALVMSGRIGADALAPISKLANDFALAMGKDVAEIGPQLVKLFEDPAKGAAELNAQMHFLSLAEQEQIASLVRMGEVSEAQLLLSEKLGAQVPKHAENLGTLAKAWQAVKNASSGAWDSMLAVGRGPTLEEKLAEVQKKIASANTRSGAYLKQDVKQPTRGGGGSYNPYQRLLDEQDSLLGQINEARMAADDKSAEAKRNAFLSGEMEKAKAKSPSYKITSLQDENQGLDKALTMENEAIQAARDAGDKKALQAHQASAQVLQDALTANNKAMNDIRAKGGKEQYETVIGDEQQIQKDLNDTFKWGVEDQKQQLAEGLISKEEALRAESALANYKLDGIEQSYLREEEAARKHGDKVKAARFAAEADRMAMDRAALPQALGNQIGANTNKINQEAGAITTKLSDAYAKEGRTRQEAEDTALMSESQKRLADALSKVNEKAISAREALDLKFAERKVDADVYKKGIADIDAAQQAAAASAKVWSDRQDELNASWSYGADKALTKYLDSVKNVAASSEKLMTDAFSGMEDALVKFAQTGKLDFSSLANSIIADMIRMQVRAAMAPATQGLSGWLSGLWNGGNVGAGQDVANTPDTYSIPVSSPSVSVLGSANGNVFASSDLHSYVNQVRDTPTYFNMGGGPRAFAAGGVFAEAGPEAVMPLTRDSAGRLGVRSQSGGGANGVVINVVESPGNGGQVQQTPGSNGGPDIVNIMVEKVSSSLVASTARGGPLASLLERRYGLSPAMGSVR